MLSTRRAFTSVAPSFKGCLEYTSATSSPEIFPTYASVSEIWSRTTDAGAATSCTATPAVLSGFMRVIISPASSLFSSDASSAMGIGPLTYGRSTPL
eukprot:CAMPEP_0206037538 /NCGR_PEP_ID=MMETSP1466-20131121/3520_1 /ASSEMBLY_ACC=CAM_ASM_001126 /TAXON_ID=44452 /ORGANISM="Pavlova gyrans, Strain CCMP608" /LENGTH=96 /DNA_ID=CAMNT_0053412093 /DNA_START=491 /DNA_END=781 /DNA_ORIENTATION=-